MQKKDELGDVYRISVKLQKTLHTIVTDIKDSADNLTVSSNKLIKMAQDTQESVNDVYQAVGEISEGARNQADETTDANTNVVRIGEQIEYISDKVNSLTDYAGRMAEAEKASEEIMKELNSSNESTKESVLRVAEQIKDMNGAIQNITKAVSMIQDIADETDLLSLNASIEAARAGKREEASQWWQSRSVSWLTSLSVPQPRLSRSFKISWSLPAEWWRSWVKWKPT